MSSDAKARLVALISDAAESLLGEALRLESEVTELDAALRRVVDAFHGIELEDIEDLDDARDAIEAARELLK